MNEEYIDISLLNGFHEHLKNAKHIHELEPEPCNSTGCMAEWYSQKTHHHAKHCEACLYEASQMFGNVLKITEEELVERLKKSEQQ